MRAVYEKVMVEWGEGGLRKVVERAGEIESVYGTVSCMQYAAPYRDLDCGYSCMPYPVFILTSRYIFF